MGKSHACCGGGGQRGEDGTVGKGRAAEPEVGNVCKGVIYRQALVFLELCVAQKGNLWQFRTAPQGNPFGVD